MATIACPWCESDQPFATALVEKTEETFTCSECGTTVLFVDEGATALPSAA